MVFSGGVSEDEDDLARTSAELSEQMEQNRREQQKAKGKEQWMSQRRDLEDAWQRIAPGNVDVALARMAWVEQTRKSDNALRVAKVQSEYAAVVPHVREECAHCRGRRWTLGDSTFAITLLFLEFVHKVELPVLLCSQCNKAAPFNPLYIDMFPSSPTDPV